MIRRKMLIAGMIIIVTDKPALGRREALPGGQEDHGRRLPAHHLQRVPPEDHRPQLDEPVRPESEDRGLQ